MPSIVIKRANKTHTLLMARLGWQTFFDAYCQYNTKEDMEEFLKLNFTEERISREISDSRNTFLLSYLGREAVGYAKLSEGSAPLDLQGTKTIELARIYAIKQKIGSGVGKVLMETCIDIAKEKDKEVIWLGVWEYNQRAIQFYRKFGFEKFGEHTFMLGSDKQNDWIMKKEL